MRKHTLSVFLSPLHTENTHSLTLTERERDSARACVRESVCVCAWHLCAHIYVSGICVRMWHVGVYVPGICVRMCVASVWVCEWHMCEYARSISVSVCVAR